MTNEKIVTLENLKLYNDILQDNIKDYVVNLMYPVGSIYISTANTSPKDLFNVGEWTQIKDTFLLASGDTYTPGSTGGEASHKLTYSELPEINGEIIMHHAAIGTNIANAGGCFTGDSIVQGKYRQGGTLLDADTVSIGKIKYTNGGANQPHNNMPPYLAVYVWKRIS